MITFEQARDKAWRHLQERNQAVSEDEWEAVLIDSATKTFEFGWVFFYQNRKYLETGDISFAFAGNAPILVDHTTEQLHVTGTAGGLEYYLSNYRLTGDPHREPVWHLTFARPEDSARTAEAMRLFRDLFELPLLEAKRTVDNLLKGAELTLHAGTHEHAILLSTKFREVGFPSQLVAR